MEQQSQVVQTGGSVAVRRLSYDILNALRFTFMILKYLISSQLDRESLSQNYFTSQESTICYTLSLNYCMDLILTKSHLKFPFLLGLSV